ncbi:somatostatin receptor type 2-like [Delphinapterus leucas]|uniref:Somatostatin receptor type 2-like n=1 Tax=Delphinapterus leucas TaxID=9749 RepID=A0A2Y9N806_DELLE|nr:somatostatin receptor type 2-like [Delphinapterus leucas]
MNSSAGDLGVGAGGRSPWGDPAGFIVVPTAYALAPGLGLPANVAALAVFVRRGRRLGQALRLHLLNLAMADVLFMLTLTLWLTYYLGPTHWPFPEAACCAAGTTYCVSTYADLAFAALTSVCRCGSVCPPSPALLGPRPRHVCCCPAGRPGLCRTLAGHPACAAPQAGQRQRRPGLRHRGLLPRRLPAGACGLCELGAGARCALGPGPGPRPSRSKPARGQDHGARAPVGLCPLPGALPPAAGALGGRAGGHRGPRRQRVPGHLHA